MKKTIHKTGRILVPISLLLILGATNIVAQKPDSMSNLDSIVVSSAPEGIFIYPLIDDKLIEDMRKKEGTSSLRPHS